MKTKDEKQPLHVKYRPKTWDEVIGNKGTIKSLRAVLKEGKVRTFLLIGSTGCGKTTLARLIKDELKCSDIDFQEINASNNRGIDTVRDIYADSRFNALQGDTKVFLLDECHQITGAAAEALLKITEEAPRGVYFVLATTNPEKLTETLRGRCSPFTVYRLDPMELKELLQRVIDEEQIVGVTDKVMREIAKAAEGNPRQALVILEQIMNLNTENEMLEGISSVTVIERDTRELCRAFLWGDWNRAVQVLIGIEEIKGDKKRQISPLDQDPENVRRAVLGYMMKVILSNEKEKDVAKAANVIRIFSDSFFSTGKPGLVYACWRCFS